MKKNNTTNAFSILLAFLFSLIAAIFFGYGNMNNGMTALSLAFCNFFVSHLYIPYYMIKDEDEDKDNKEESEEKENKEKD